MKNTFLKPTVFVSLLCILSIGVGCLFEPAPFKPVRNFDLGEPEKVPMPVRVEVGDFKLASLYGSRFMIRKNDTEVVADEYNRWIQWPNVLVEHYLNMAFVSTSDAAETGSPSVIVSGTVLVFEYLLDTDKARLVIVGELTDDSSGRTERFREDILADRPTGEPLPKGVALAMNAAMSEFVDRLVGRVRGMAEHGAQ